MVSQSRPEILRIIELTYAEVYLQPGDTLPRITEETHIGELGILDNDSIYALDWRHRIAQELNINERNLPKPEHGKNYKVEEIIDIFKAAPSKR